jgi:hypothetical protein
MNSPGTREPETCCTSPQQNSHISERRTVHYPWHPWRDRSVFIDERVEKHGRIMFRCHAEETRHWSALEIPDWMFDSAWGKVYPVDAPTVGCEALRSLKVLLAAASNHDPMVKEALCMRYNGEPYEPFRGRAPAPDLALPVVHRR